MNRIELPITVRVDGGLAPGMCMIWDARGGCCLKPLAGLDFDPSYRLLLISSQDAVLLRRRSDSRK